MTRVIDRVAGALRQKADKYSNPQRYIVAQTVLETAEREVFLSTSIIISAFFTGPYAGKTIYETMAFVDGESVDHAWTTGRADAVETHYRFLDLLRLDLALSCGEPVTHEDHWPRAIETRKEVE